MVIYRIVQRGLDATVAYLRDRGFSVQTIPERLEELIREAEHVVEKIGRAEYDCNWQRVKILNARYRRLGDMIVAEIKQLPSKPLI